MPTFTTFVTTKRYAEGAICLAQSLLLYHVPRPVLIIQSTRVCFELLKTLAANDLPVDAVVVQLLPDEEATSTSDVPEGERTHNGAGAKLEFDSPRRSLFSKGDPFVYLDCDLLCVAPPMESLRSAFECLREGEYTIAAVPPFRLKKQAYGNADGGFNAGVILCHSCSVDDIEKIDRAVASAMEEAKISGESVTTEERILSDVFKTRWLELDPKLNLIKRVYKHAPRLWLKLRQNCVFVHYMGAKPWFTPAEKAQADWDSDGYDKLESIWHQVRRNQFADGETLTQAFLSV